MSDTIRQLAQVSDLRLLQQEGKTSRGSKRQRQLCRRSLPTCSRSRNLLGRTSEPLAVKTGSAPKRLAQVPKSDWTRYVTEPVQVLEMPLRRSPPDNCARAAGAAARTVAVSARSVVEYMMREGVYGKERESERSLVSWESGAEPRPQRRPSACQLSARTGAESAACLRQPSLSSRGAAVVQLPSRTR